ncbi:MAG: sugar kinase [Deltaproteobacteria bacterium]|nr:sugar kinase [Deltaproteobacteria bacterium]
MRVAGIGQCSLDYLGVVGRYPEADEKAELCEWVEDGGGPAGTAVVTLARLGVPCAFFGVVGDDEAGRKVRSGFEVDGVDVRGLKIRRGETSQVAFIAIDKSSGTRTIFWRRPTGTELRPSEIPKDFPKGFDFVHLDGLMREVSIFAAKKARAAGVPVMLDAGRQRPWTLEIARHCDYVVGSEQFALDLGLRSEIAKKVLSLGVKACTITLGSRGSITFTKNDFFKTPAFKVDVVDTTGAGDVFHGAHIYGLLKKWDLRKVVRFASAVAALKCIKIGGRKGIPTLRAALRLAGWHPRMGATDNRRLFVCDGVDGVASSHEIVTGPSELC